ncbi:hypothetical protein HYPSUDRAFT_46515, partial [Hypholoma sublateritium FD-334 SS-4]
QLETLEGLPIGGRFSSRRLRRFIPRVGTKIAQAQTEIEARMGLQEDKADNPDNSEVQTTDESDGPDHPTALEDGQPDSEVDDSDEVEEEGENEGEGVEREIDGEDARS